MQEICQWLVNDKLTNRSIKEMCAIKERKHTKQDISQSNPVQAYYTNRY